MISHRALGHLSLFLLALFSVFPSDGAELGDTLLPKEEEREPERPSPVRSTEGEVGGDEILLENLQGLVAGTEEPDLLKVQQSNAAGFSATGMDEKTAGALAKAAKPYLGKPVTLNQLDKLARELEKAWQKSTGNLATASFPPQEITGGTIGILLGNRVAGDVRVAGKTTFGGDFIKKEFRTRKGDTLSARSITEDLAWINDNPYRRVDLTYTDGDVAGVSDLLLSVNERKPLRFYSGFDNYSNARVGGERLFAGFGWGNVWGLDHRFSYQYTTDTNFDKLTGQSFVYEAPLPWRHKLSLVATLSDADADLAGSQVLNGTFREFNANYIIPLPSNGEMRHELSLGLEYRENSYELASGTGASVDNFVRFFLFTSAYEAKIPDKLGFTVLDCSLRYSPGDGFLAIDDPEYKRLSTDADSHFLIGRLRLDRTWWLPANQTLFTRLEGQWSDSPLLASERFSATGVYDVRGYDESDAFGDNVFRFTAEWRFPSFSILGNRLGDSARDRLQLYTFWDYAFLHNRVVNTDEKLSSVGLGAKYQIGQHLSMRMDYGIPIAELRGEDKAPRLHFSAFFTF